MNINGLQIIKEITELSLPSASLWCCLLLPLRCVQGRPSFAGIQTQCQLVDATWHHADYTVWWYLQFFNFLISCLLCVCQMIVDFLLRPKNEPKRHTSFRVTFSALFTQTQCQLLLTMLVVLETHMRPTPSYSRVLSGNEVISVWVSRACFWTLVSWSICRSASLAFCCVSITLACSSVKAYRKR